MAHENPVAASCQQQPSALSKHSSKGSSNRRRLVAAAVLAGATAAMVVAVASLVGTAHAIAAANFPVRLAAIHIQSATSVLGKTIDPDDVAELLSGMYVSMMIEEVELHSSEDTSEEEAMYIMPGTQMYQHLAYMRLRSYWHSARDAPIRGFSGADDMLIVSPGNTEQRRVDEFWKDVIPSVHDKVDELFYCPLLGHKVQHTLRFKAKIESVQEPIIKRRHAPISTRQYDQRKLQKKLKGMIITGLVSHAGSFPEAQIIMVIRRPEY